jgi:hypothetical protein
MCSPWCPSPSPPVGSALPSPGSSEASSPASTVLWRCATPCTPLAALRCLRLAIPCGVPGASLPAVQDTKPRAWGSYSGPHIRTVPQGGNQGLPRFPDNPLSLCPVLRPRQDRTRQAIATCRHGPRYVHNEGSHDNPAFEAQSHGFRTRCLRFVRYSYPHPTQNSLPAAGQALPDGLAYPQGCYERFPTLVFLLSRA